MKKEKGSSCENENIKKNDRKKRDLRIKEPDTRDTTAVEALESDSITQNRHKQSSSCEPCKNLKKP